MTPDPKPRAARQEPEAPGPRLPTPGRARGFVRFILMFITAVILVDTVFGEKGVLALSKSRRQLDRIERALDQAREENQALRAEARRLREDSSAIEALARGELGLIKPGEKLFIIRDITRKH